MENKKDREIPVLQIDPGTRRVIRQWSSYQAVFPADEEKTLGVYKCCYRVLNHLNGQMYRFIDDVSQQKPVLMPIRDEVFAPIEFVDGYDCSGFAEVSNMGRVRFLHNKTGLRVKVRPDGAKFVKLRVNGTEMRDFFIHRLVASIFIDHPVITETMIVKHMDGNKGNNLVENLQWHDRCFLTRKK